MRNNLFSPSQPINHSVSERVSLSASTRLEKLFRNKRKGSVTVEAAATVTAVFPGGCDTAVPSGNDGSTYCSQEQSAVCRKTGGKRHLYHTDADAVKGRA